jgi:hypothetical protein
MELATLLRDHHMPNAEAYVGVAGIDLVCCGRHDYLRVARRPPALYAVDMVHSSYG